MEGLCERWAPQISLNFCEKGSANFYVEEYRKTTVATGFHVTSSDTETATFDNIESSAREKLIMANCEVQRGRSELVLLHFGCNVYNEDRPV